MAYSWTTNMLMLLFTIFILFKLYETSENEKKNKRKLAPKKLTSTKVLATKLSPTKIRPKKKMPLSKKSIVKSVPTPKESIIKREIKLLVQESKKKEKFHSTNYVSVLSVNTKEHKIKREKAKKFTNTILSKPTNGDPSNRDTLFHVLASFTKSQGKECIFTQDNTNKNSKFISTLGAGKNQTCVLALDNLDDVLSNDQINSNEKEEIKLDDKEETLKKQILDIRKDIKQNKKNSTIENLKKKLGRVHSVDPKYIKINDIYYGSAHIDYEIITVTRNRNVTQAMKDEFQAYKDLKLHPLFFDQSFNINDFDERGHKTFSSGSTFQIGPTTQKQTYTQPSGWSRYGLKVLDGRYGTNNKWLHPFGDPGNWYRAYHGTASNFGKLILNGQNNKAFFRPGHGQAYKNSANGNPLSGGGTVGVGVYCSPLPQSAESYCKNHVTIQTSQGPKQYKFMFQVCVDPTKVKFTSRKDYWVVPDAYPDAIRPYGILLKQM